ncbi:MAG: RodZ domain-containing protein [Thermacetogeniaceae bacterium]|nr:helix-turn-helix domain-containing protein [Syntrophomonadaceae bacterium]
MKIGELLRAERENKGLSLFDVEEKTKIRAKYLQALEEENFEEIPGEAYRIGFLRNYALFLELDPEPLLYQYRAQHKRNELDSLHSLIEQQRRAKTGEAKSESFGRTKLGYALIAIIIFTAAFLYFSSLNGENPPIQEQNPPVAEEEQKEPEQAEAPPQPEIITLEIVGKQQCWTEVRVDGTVQFSGHIYPGDTKSFEAEDSIQLTLGNAGGVDLIYNGKKEPPPGKAGEVVNKEYKRIE